MFIGPEDLSTLAFHLRGSTDLLTRLTQLLEGCRELEEFAAEYDYSPEVPGNGFRSFISICSILVRNISQVVEGKCEKSKRLIKDYGTMTNTLIKILDLLRIVRTKGTEFDASLISETDILITTKAFMLSESDIAPVYDSGSCGPFWLSDFSRSDAMLKSLALNFLASGTIDRTKMLLSKSSARGIMSHNAFALTLEQIKKPVAYLDMFPMNLALKVLPYRSGVHSKSVLVQRSSPFLIRAAGSRSDIHETEIIIDSSAKREGSSIRCLLLTSSSSSSHSKGSNDSCLMFHVHGGAFVVGKPEFFVPSISRPCHDFNVPVISVDYALAPENRFPAGMQDILDVYMFLTSGSNEVRRMLGFHPKTIVLSGESSGANMCLELCIALHKIQKAGHPVLMPKGLSLQVPCTAAAPIVLPSITYAAIDPALTPAIIAIVFGSYPRHEEEVPRDNWHRTPDCGRILRNIRSNDPLFNVLAGDCLQQLTGMQLSLFLAEFDPLLDQGIAIAKKWPSKVRLRIGKGMTHMFELPDKAAVAADVQWVQEGVAELLGRKSIP